MSTKLWSDLIGSSAFEAPFRERRPFRRKDSLLDPLAIGTFALAAALRKRHVWPFSRAATPTRE